MVEDPRIPHGADRDPLETELESFRPLPMSPELVERIGSRLSGDAGGPAPHLTSSRRLLLIGLGAAACVAVAFYLWADREGDASMPGQIAATRPTDPSPIVIKPQLPPPSRAAYQRALAESPEVLDALLDAHAARLLPLTGASSAPNTFHSSKTKLSTLTGDIL